MNIFILAVDYHTREWTMILKRLRLSNIRSYTDATIEFPEGSVLLAGDIGSGKSTVLLAIEFALFGIKTQELPGSSLLRHGKREGSVELEFSVEKEEILIKRVLKQTAQGIGQEAGYIIRGGVKKDATPKELRAIIFEILGYPKDLVGKSKDLVYRYTVYTPQEAMKDILYAKKEERLDILRRVFNVDKYKRIRENTIIILGTLKERRKELEGFCANLAEKKKEQDQLACEQEKLTEKMRIIQPALLAAKMQVQEKAGSVEKIEKEAIELNALKREFAALEAKNGAILEQRRRTAIELERMEKEISHLQAEVLGKEPQDCEPVIMGRRAQLFAEENELRTIRHSISSQMAKKEQSEETSGKVQRLENCPLCMQQVTHEHKRSIADDEARKQKEFTQIIEKNKEHEKLAIDAIETLQKDLDVLRKKQGETLAIKAKIQALERRQRDKSEKENSRELLKKELGQINIRKLELSIMLEHKKDTEQKYTAARKELDLARQEERKIELEHTSVKKEAEGIERILSIIGKDIREKTDALEKLRKLRELHEWLSEFFMNLMLTIERHVMLQINKEFSELFKSWFSTLMEDEMLSVRLDDEFTPQIEQDGYETSIDNLSGGEKTSVALSYRLALNKVINDIVAEIKTKDILMLDEPTDGFSTEQLDKVREVLEMLHIKQIILVSHEPKIESFVDKVIRVVKQEHVSRVFA